MSTTNRVRRAAIAWVVIACLVGAAASAGRASKAAVQPGLGHLTLSARMPLSDGTIGKPAALAMRRGYLAENEAAYRRAKADANAKVANPARVERHAARGFAPVQNSGFDGLVDPNSAPSDSTGNVGSTRFIELVNSKIGIYNKTSPTPISTATLSDLAGGSGEAFDPQVMWDAQTNRFYYTMDDVISSTQNVIALGFSKTASPNNATSAFCHYNVNFGSNFPDYPKLGDSQSFFIVGSNVFNSANAFQGSDAFAIGKPSAAAITTCPAASSLVFGEGFNLRDPSGGASSTPVPVNEIDNNPTGYIVARCSKLPCTRMLVHRVTRNPTTGAPVFQLTGSTITVPSYAMPPSAVQRSGFADSQKTLDTLDGRFTQAVGAVDPAHNNAFAVWTQHTVATNPAGRSEVRWHEFSATASTATLLQSGKATNATLFSFNGSISPDRARNGSTSKFGSNMVLGFDTSGPSAFPAVRMLSKLGPAAPSAAVQVRGSPGNYGGFDCAGTNNLCRWGDYASASPDPVAASGATKGKVWLVSQYASGGTSTTQANWNTWDFTVTP